jgi:hypothetical protein
VERELFGSVLAIAFSFSPEVSAKSPVCFRRNLFRDPLVGRDIEEQPPAIGDDVAPLGGRGRMRDGALALVGKERLSDAFAAGAIIVATSRALSDALGIISRLEFVIFRGGPIEFVDGRRRVVERRRVNSNETAFFVALESRPELQSRHALLVDRDEMQAVGGHLQRNLLDGMTVAAHEQRRLPAVL